MVSTLKNNGGKMAKKLIVRSELVPYLNLFDMNKEWLDLKTNRSDIWKSIREQRREMYNLTMKINEVEKRLAETIVKLEKKQ